MLETALEQDIRKIVREEINKGLSDFLVKLKLELIPFVSEEEQREIEKNYGEELLENDEKDVVITRLADEIKIRGGNYV